MISEYPSFSRLELLTRLAVVVDSLYAAIDERATAEAEEVSGRINGYFSSQATTERGREWDSKRASEPATLALIEVRAQIEALIEEKFLLIRLLDMKDRNA